MAGSAMAQSTVIPSVFYNKNGNNTDIFISDSIYTYDEASSDRTIYGKEIKQFSENYLPLSNVNMTFDPVWETFANKYKTEYEYDEEGRLVKESSYNNSSPDASSGETVWTMGSYTEYYYTDGINDSILLYRSVYGSEGEFYLNTRTLLKYDSSNRLSEESKYTRWSNTAELALSTITEYDYDSSGSRLKEKRTNNYSNNSKMSINIDRYFYDGNNNMIADSIYLISNMEDQKEELQAARDYEYNDKNQLTKEWYSKADQYTLQWGPFFRWEFEYDETDNYPSKMEYYVYNLDFTESPLNQTKEYFWTKVATLDVENTSDGTLLKIAGNGDERELRYAGTMQQAAIYDMGGRPVRIYSGIGSSVCRIDPETIGKGIYIAVVYGNKGTAAVKFTIK